MCLMTWHLDRETHAYYLCSYMQLPSLANLRAGAQQLLDWLYQQYWHKQVR